MKLDYPSLTLGLVGAWCPSLGASGYSLIDRSGLGNHGTLTNMGGQFPWRPSAGVSALAFDGVNDYVAMTRVPPQVLGTNAPFTICGWLLQSTLRTNDHAFKFGSASTNNGFGVFRSGSGNQIVVGFHATPASEATTPGDILANTWYHVAATVTTSLRELFLNGVSVATSTNSVTYSLGTSFCFLGSAQSALVPWNGSLDDWRIYSRTLTRAEIALLASRRGIGLVPQRQRRATLVGPQFFVSVSGVWRSATPFVNVGGAWKTATPATRVGGTWR